MNGCIFQIYKPLLIAIHVNLAWAAHKLTMSPRLLNLLSQFKKYANPRSLLLLIQNKKLERTGEMASNLIYWHLAKNTEDKEIITRTIVKCSHSTIYHRTAYTKMKTDERISNILFFSTFKTKFSLP